MAADWSVKTWDVNQATLVAFGVTITKGAGQSGMADGQFLELEQDGKSFEVKKGADGSVVRVAKNEPVSYLRVHLMQTSEANGVFSAIHNKDIASTNGAGVGTCAVADQNGTTTFASMKCWITGPPKLAWGGEPGELVWEIACAQNTRFDGGN